MKVYGVLPVNQVLECLGKSKGYFKFNGFSPRLNSNRLRLFKRDAIKCVKCGVEADVFFLESRGDDYPHLNAYKLMDNGEHLLFTKDHIIPKSKGGPDHLSNMQIMCERCNQRKGNTYTETQLTD